LAIAQRAQIEPFLAGFSGWRSLGAAARRAWGSHVLILDAKQGVHRMTR